MALNDLWGSTIKGASKQPKSMFKIRLRAIRSFFGFLLAIIVWTFEGGFRDSLKLKKWSLMISGNFDIDLNEKLTELRNELWRAFDCFFRLPPQPLGTEVEERFSRPPFWWWKIQSPIKARVNIPIHLRELMQWCCVTFRTQTEKNVTRKGGMEHRHLIQLASAVPVSSNVSHPRSIDQQTGQPTLSGGSAAESPASDHLLASAERPQATPAERLSSTSRGAWSSPADRRWRAVDGAASLPPSRLSGCTRWNLTIQWMVRASCNRGWTEPTGTELGWSCGAASATTEAGTTVSCLAAAVTSSEAPHASNGATRQWVDGAGEAAADWAYLVSSGTRGTHRAEGTSRPGWPLAAPRPATATIDHAAPGGGDTNYWPGTNR